MRDRPVAFPDYDFYSQDSLFAAFAAGPSRLRLSLAGLAEAELHARPRGERSWSIHEIVLHTADSELQGTFRVRKVWSEPGAALPGYDQDAWAREIDYASRGPKAREEALALLTLLRAQSLALFSVASAADWAKRGTHPEYGPITLRNLLELYADHSERHVEQILDIRTRLGRPLAMASALPRRLY